MNVLIVDDVDTNRKLLRITLQSAGHGTTEAVDGIDALDVLSRRSFDAIISDILMPRMDGYRLCHEVRRIEALKGILFIFYTSTFTASADEKLALEMGADRFLRKPSPLKEILAALEPAGGEGRQTDVPPRQSVARNDIAELGALQGYSEVLVRKLEHRNAELQLVRDQLIRTNTELLSRSEELRASRLRLEVTANQLQSLFDNLDDIFFSVDMGAARFLRISPAVERVLGVRAEAFAGNPQLWRDLVLPADRSQIEQAEAELRAGNRWQSELRVQHPEGSPFWVLAKIKPLVDASGALIRIDGVVSDITARKQLEAELLHSQKLEAVGRLAGGITHDFNNFLSVILGFSELVLEALEPGNRLRSHVEEIVRAGHGASGLTRQLLAFSRKQVLDPAIFDLNCAVKDVETILRRLIGEDIQLATRLDPELKLIRADPGQIDQVIINLAVNSRDAMPLGGRLTIETENVELDSAYVLDHVSVPPGKYVMLAVSDSGCGMDRETQARLFEPFFTTKEPGKGTGLGLATVYGIVKQTEGHIWVYSEVGKGTTFRIYLPPAQREDRVATAFSTEPAALRTGSTILVAEDDEAVRRVVVAFLAGAGYTVLEAGNGAEALQTAVQPGQTIDLLLTDTIMPGMNGRVLAQALKQLRPDVKVLYMSGYTGDAVVLHDLLESGDAFLQKPFGSAALLRKISEALNAV
jgi:two-component system cell cycle sensor histidine kinase/response regulator CckA